MSIVAGGDEQAGDEQQGVAGQEEAEQDAAFGENDQHDAEHGPRAHVVDQGFRAQPTGQQREVSSGHELPRVNGCWPDPGVIDRLETFAPGRNLCAGRSLGSATTVDAMQATTAIRCRASHRRTRSSGDHRSLIAAPCGDAVGPANVVVDPDITAAYSRDMMPLAPSGHAARRGVPDRHRPGGRRGQGLRRGRRADRAARRRVRADRGGQRGRRRGHAW